MTRSMRWAIALGMIAGGALADTAEVPQGCEAYVTVHKDSCYATTYARCDGSVVALSYADGDLQDTHIFGPQWDLIGYFADGDRMGTEAAEGSAPETSLREALDTGVSFGSREMVFKTGVLKGATATMEAHMSFGSDMIELDGTVLRVGHVSRKFTIHKNGVTAQWDFALYATEDEALLIEGNAEVDQFGRKSTLEWTPRKLSRPGEAGFLATTSEYACE